MEVAAIMADADSMAGMESEDTASDFLVEMKVRAMSITGSARKGFSGRRIYGE